MNRSHHQEVWNWGLIAVLGACLLFWMSVAGATIWVVRGASDEASAVQHIADLAGPMSQSAGTVRASQASI
jgi:hypothetical protein